MSSDARAFVDFLLAGGTHEQQPPDQSNDFEVAVGMLVRNGLTRSVAAKLMEEAKGRRENLIKRAEQMVDSREKYQRRLDEDRRRMVSS